MKGPMPDGSEVESWGHTVFREIVEPERIVSVDAFADAAGKVNEGLPAMVVTVSFGELAGQTSVTSRAEFATAADLETVIQMGMEEGMSQSWDQLDAYLVQLQNS